MEKRKIHIIRWFSKSVVIASTALALSNCGPGYSNAQRDATTGALIGGAAGGIIGHQSGNTAAGAAIGAGVGGATGYAVGNEKDKRRGGY
ncbi:glycine zipper domain-containing protein [Haloferula chungangensis]|uniref:Glycine zipper domain-containing protein n=1 Tax=Haloferula chungangensis TaxID=1048331 RepID=A0ABW2LAJ1_9BACT